MYVVVFNIIVLVVFINILKLVFIFLRVMESRFEIASYLDNAALGSLRMSFFLAFVLGFSGFFFFFGTGGGDCCAIWPTVKSQTLLREFE